MKKLWDQKSTEILSTKRTNSDRSMFSESCNQIYIFTNFSQQNFVGPSQMKTQWKYRWGEKNNAGHAVDHIVAALKCAHLINLIMDVQFLFNQFVSLSFTLLRTHSNWCPLKYVNP